jgi:hypothetical protein
MVIDDASAPVALAKESLRYFLATGQILPVPDEVPILMQGRAGTFVSLKKNDQLRGCIGTFQPTKPDIATEIIHNAISAGTQDPRFQPVKPEELPELTISVDILEEPEQIDSIHELDPKRYGVIVTHGRRSGLLLPMLEGVNTAEEQVSIAMQKASISPDEEIDLYRFTVTRYT